LRGSPGLAAALLLLLVLLPVAVPAPLVAVGQSGERLYSSGGPVDYSVSEVYLDFTVEEYFVGSYYVNGLIAVVTSSRIMLFSPDTLEVVGEKRLELLAALDSGLSSEGFVVKGYVEGGDGVRYAVSLVDAETLEHRWFIEFPVDLWVSFAADRNSRDVAVIVERDDFVYELLLVRGGERVWSRVVEFDFYVAKLRVSVKPGGGAVAVAASDDRGAGSKLVVFDGEGRAVYEDDAGRPPIAWSPDGSTLYYVSGPPMEARLVALDTATLESRWELVFPGGIAPEEGLKVNPSGCCVYADNPLSDKSYYVVDAETGEASVRSGIPMPGSFHGSGLWGLLLTRIATVNLEVRLVEKLGLAWVKIDGQSTLLTWRGVLNPRVRILDSGWLGDGRFYVVTALNEDLRLTVFDWPRPAVVYVDAGAYSGYYKFFRVEAVLPDGGSDEGAGKALIVKPGPPIQASLYLVPDDTRITVESPLGGEAFIMGDLGRVAETPVPVTLPELEPLGEYTLRVEEAARLQWFHLRLYSWEECPISEVSVEFEGGSDSVAVGRESSVLLALPAGETYRVTASFEAGEPGAAPFGEPEPATHTVEAVPGGVGELAAVKWGRLVVEGGEAVVEPLWGGEPVRVTAYTGKRLCVPPGGYRVTVKYVDLEELGIHAILAPPDWEPSTTVTVGEGEEARVNLLDVVESQLAILTVRNASNASYTVAIATSDREEAIGLILGPGEEETVALVAGYKYLVAYEPAQGGGDQGIVEVEPSPGERLTLLIPQGETAAGEPPQEEQAATETAGAETATEAEEQEGEEEQGPQLPVAPEIAVAAAAAILAALALGAALLRKR